MSRRTGMVGTSKWSYAVAWRTYQSFGYWNNRRSGWCYQKLERWSGSCFSRFPSHQSSFGFLQSFDSFFFQFKIFVNIFLARTKVKLDEQLLRKFGSVIMVRWRDGMVIFSVTSRTWLTQWTMMLRWHSQLIIVIKWASKRKSLKQHSLKWVNFQNSIIEFTPFQEWAFGKKIPF